MATATYQQKSVNGVRPHRSLTAIDEQVRDKEVEGNTVGILLCKSRNRVVVEYALKNVNQPIAVSTYELEKMGLASPKAITDGLTRLLEK